MLLLTEEGGIEEKPPLESIHLSLNLLEVRVVLEVDYDGKVVSGLSRHGAEDI